MTATLRPPPDAVARSDFEARLKDYTKALGYYLAQPPRAVQRILFVDNSNGGIAQLEATAAAIDHDKCVEFISFDDNRHPPALGKAYGEFKLIDRGLDLSETVDADDWVWKVTGRLALTNLDRLQRLVAGREYDIVCDLHNIPWVGSGRLRGNRSMDLRTFAFRRSAYDSLYRGAWDRTERFDAYGMYDITMQARRTLNILPRFPRQPLFDGISGRHLQNYASLSGRTKSAIRDALRRVAPFIWL